MKLERVPPDKETSDAMKSTDASESVKVRDAVSPAFKEEASEAKAMVGAVVSMTIACDAAEPELPAASVTRN